MHKQNADSYGRSLSNREKGKAPRRGVYWCGYCDAALVGDHGKCPRCGARNRPDRHHKSMNPRI